MDVPLDVIHRALTRFARSRGVAAGATPEAAVCMAGVLSVLVGSVARTATQAAINEAACVEAVTRSRKRPRDEGTDTESEGGSCSDGSGDSDSDSGGSSGGGDSENSASDAPSGPHVQLRHAAVAVTRLASRAVHAPSSNGARWYVVCTAANGACFPIAARLALEAAHALQAVRHEAAGGAAAADYPPMLDGYHPVVLREAHDLRQCIVNWLEDHLETPIAGLGTMFGDRPATAADLLELDMSHDAPLAPAAADVTVQKDATQARTTMLRAKLAHLRYPNVWMSFPSAMALAHMTGYAVAVYTLDDAAVDAGGSAAAMSVSPRVPLQLVHVVIPPEPAKNASGTAADDAPAPFPVPVDVALGATEARAAARFFDDDSSDGIDANAAAGGAGAPLALAPASPLPDSTADAPFAIRLFQYHEHYCCLLTAAEFWTLCATYGSGIVLRRGVDAPQATICALDEYVRAVRFQ